MTDNVVLKRFLAEKCLSFVLITLTLLISLVISIYFSFWTLGTFSSGMIIIIWSIYARIAYRIKHGTFGSTHYEREALDAWFKKNGATPIRGMRLPG